MMPSQRFFANLTPTAAWFATAAPDIVREALPGYLATRRWFGDKTRRISAVRLVDAHLADATGTVLALAIVEVEFVAGRSATYFVPLALLNSRCAADDIIAEVMAGEEIWIVADAAAIAGFQRWLLTELAAHAELTGARGRFSWRATGALSELLSTATTGPSRLSTVQQSNSSIVYGQSLIVKLFRKAQPGPNPEVEIGRFLTTQTAFRNIPLLLGELAYRPDDGEPLTLGVAQSYVRSVADGWAFTLDRLDRIVADSSGAPSPWDAIQAYGQNARRLGELTGQLHVALSSAPWIPDLAPETIGVEDVAGWSAGVAEALDRTASALAGLAPAVDDPTHELIAAFRGLTPRLAAQATGFEQLVGRTKTRVHGDYHLGQTLRTVDADFVILDFEGEPQRSIEERRAKTSPLKDVAGMLRSLSYARGVATQRARSKEQAPTATALLVTWERTARAAFLDGYIVASRIGNAAYLPTSDDDIRLAVIAWELDKALYEVNYELNNRPDWLWLPLSSILKDA